MGRGKGQRVGRLRVATTMRVMLGRGAGRFDLDRSTRAPNVVEPFLELEVIQGRDRGYEGHGHACTLPMVDDNFMSFLMCFDAGLPPRSFLCRKNAGLVRNVIFE